MPVDKNAIYQGIKTAGLLALIPITLATGPLGGYLAADLLVKKLGFPKYTFTVCVILGFLAGIQETVKIVKTALKNK